MTNLPDIQFDLTRFLQNLSLGIVVRDTAGEIIIYNEAAEKLLGLTADQMQYGQAPPLGWELLDENGNAFDPGAYPSHICLQTGKPQTDILMGVKKTGNDLTWLSTSSDPIFSSGNKTPDFVVTTYTDITERRKTEEKLRQSEEQYHRMVNEVQDYAVLLLNKEGLIQNWNLGAEAIKGYKEYEIIGKPISVFYLPEDIKNGLPEKLLADAVKDGKAADEGWRVRKDGTLFWATIVISTIHDDLGNIIGFSKVTRDTTERKLNLDALENERKRFSDLTQNVPGVIYQWEEKSDGTYGFTYVSPRFKEYFNLEVDEMGNIENYIHPGDKERWRASIEEANRTGKPWFFEGRLLYPDNSVIWWQGASKMSVSNSDKKIYNGIMININDRKKTEEDLQKLNERLTVSNQELEQFAYVASHDLQEPLRMVSSFLQLLQKKYAGQLDEKADQYINFAVEGSERMKKLINDLLNFSRISTDYDNKEMVDCNAVLKGVLKILDPVLKSNDARITYSGLPLITGNAVQLAQLFQNLLSNALKYRSEQKPEIEISCKENPSEWAFSVSDNGIGVDPKYNEKIFIIFQRLHNRNEYSGTGIGLAICKKIVEQHGGKIWIESEPGKGSTFYFTISKISR
ncbi:MAG: PAS domain S-box protein [Bacteroidetes bacterium]|nr:PAS domain S-box protein [Bacteroidota bacterium]